MIKIKTDLTATERLAEEARADVHTLDDEVFSVGDNFADVLEGSARAEISHAGEDVNPRLDLDEEELIEDLRASHSYVLHNDSTAVAYNFPAQSFIWQTA